jgi:hypothetical protein
MKSVLKLAIAFLPPANFQLNKQPNEKSKKKEERRKKKELRTNVRTKKILVLHIIVAFTLLCPYASRTKTRI